MTIKKKSKKTGKKTIDLTGSKGNAYYLLVTARKISEKLGLNFKDIQFEMTSGDYEHLIQTFDKFFGDYIDLER